MSEMGSTGTLNVTPEMLQSALDAVSDYREEVVRLAGEVDTIVSNLIPGNFSGSAADGFVQFYQGKVIPVTGESINTLLDGIENMINGIKSAIPGEEGADEALATENKNVGN